MGDLLRTGLGAVLVVLIMVLGSLVLWIGTPLLWLWVGSQIEGASSIGPAAGTTFIGAVLTIIILAALPGQLPHLYRANRAARVRDDPGHFVRAVLVGV